MPWLTFPGKIEIFEILPVCKPFPEKLIFLELLFDI